MKVDSSSFTFTKVGVTSVESGGWTCSGFESSGAFSTEASLPTDLVSLDNFPNPFNLSTEVFFNMPQGGEVSLEVYDLLGRKIDTVFEGLKAAGRHRLVWEAEALASGVYFLKLSAGETVVTRSVTLLK